ncbi:hypothetical protein SLEP1_g9230 [Rubroshorea leprosula]|uniref:Uncharacterized protein n=1 Tax=Rubroshorea leprosula TaxID=152421 RepID=A0AAV5IF93_9ROSI|nr:hypothetical protein SLEP1_g9230 [Rubroshorea leprosula]
MAGPEASPRVLLFPTPPVAEQKEKNQAADTSLEKPVRSLVFSPSFLVLEHTKNPEILSPSLQHPDLLCSSSPVRRLPCGCVISGHFSVREFPCSLPPASSSPCSSGFSWRILVLDLWGALVRELSARFCASEVSKFMVMLI